MTGSVWTRSSSGRGTAGPLGLGALLLVVAGGCGAMHTRAPEDLEDEGWGGGGGGDRGDRGEADPGEGGGADPGEGGGAGPGEGGGGGWDAEVPAPAAEGWTRSFGRAARPVDVLGVASGPDGAVAVVGSFLGELDLDPDAEPLAGNRGRQNGFVLVLDAEGEPRWSGAVGPGWSEVTAVVVGPGGSVVVRGHFNGVVDLDLLSGGAERDAGGASFAMFVASYDASGSLEWAAVRSPELTLREGCDGRACAGGLAVGADGSVAYSRTAGCDAGRLDAGGSPLWEVAFDAVESCAMRGVAVAEDGSVRLAGTFSGDSDLDPGPGRDPHAGRGSFVVSLDPDGRHLWGRSFGGDVHGVAAGAGGSMALVGAFNAPVDLDPGPGVDLREPSGAWWSSFVLALDAAGERQWSGTFGGPHGAQAQAVSTTAGGDLLLAGFFYDTVDFDPGPAVAEAASEGERDAFVLRLSRAGAFRWVRTYGGLEPSGAFAVSGTFDGCAVAAGGFDGAVDFRPGAATDVHEAGDRDSAFVTRLLPDGYYER